MSAGYGRVAMTMSAAEPGDGPAEPGVQADAASCSARGWVGRAVFDDVEAEGGGHERAGEQDHYPQEDQHAEPPIVIPEGRASPGCPRRDPYSGAIGATIDW